MAHLTVRPLVAWPGELTQPHRRANTFKAGWTSTVNLLEREVNALSISGRGGRVVVEMAVEERDCRLDGWIRADAQPRHPGVILSFESRFGPLRYWTDAYTTYQGNVRAIALGLEALRAVDRYGISRSGEQYVGWNAIGAGRPVALTKEVAVSLLGQAANLTKRPKPDDPDIAEWATIAFKLAAKANHPDYGGSHDEFVALTAARDLLVS